MQSYVLCATPRCGTTLLCDLLAQTRVAGRPDAFFRRQSIDDFLAAWGVEDLRRLEGPAFERAYLNLLRRQGEGGTGLFGMRVMWPSLPEIEARLAMLFPEPKDPMQRIAAAFGSVRFVRVSRRDKVAQAVSRMRAEQTGLWHLNADGTDRERVGPPVRPRYDYSAIAHYLEETSVHEQNWRNWFAARRTTPTEVHYEDLAADPIATLARLLVDLGQDAKYASHAQVKTARLADTITAAWADRFRKERRHAERRI